MCKVHPSIRNCWSLFVSQHPGEVTTPGWKDTTWTVPPSELLLMINSTSSGGRWRFPPSGFTFSLLVWVNYQRKSTVPLQNQLLKILSLGRKTTITDDLTDQITLVEPLREELQVKTNRNICPVHVSELLWTTFRPFPVPWRSSITAAQRPNNTTENITAMNSESYKNLI